MIINDAGIVVGVFVVGCRPRPGYAAAGETQHSTVDQHPTVDSVGEVGGAIVCVIFCAVVVDGVNVINSGRIAFFRCCCFRCCVVGVVAFCSGR